MPPNSAPTPTIAVRYAPYSAAPVAKVPGSNPLDGSLGLFLVLLLVVLLLIAATGIILYRIHLRKPTATAEKTPQTTPVLRQLFLPSLVQDVSPTCPECNPHSPTCAIKSDIPEPFSVRVASRVTAVVSRCKLPFFGSTRVTPTVSQEIPAIVVSACSPSTDRTHTFLPAVTVATTDSEIDSPVSPSNSIESLQVPNSLTRVTTRTDTEPTAPVSPKSKGRKASPLRVISNTSGRPFELTAPLPSRDGQVRRVGIKRHSRQRSITSMPSAKENGGKENVPPVVVRPSDDSGTRNALGLK